MKHKSAKMVMSLVISLLLVLEIIPMNVFAALNTENMNVNVSEIKNDEVPKVVAEVVEKRDEFSKVYLLEDGSYYSVTTNKWKYIKIWNAASDIRLYALSQGIYITV